MSSPLKKFNEIVTLEIQRAIKHENNEEWGQAREAWLDIIEYCLLFARKTSELKAATSQMIIEKAHKLMARVETINEKIHAEQLHAVPAAPAGGNNLPSPGPAFDTTATGVVPTRAAGTDFNIAGDEKQQALNDQLKKAMDGMEPREKGEAKPGGGQKKFIEVGDERVEIPDDFPLIEITPKDSFKPATTPSEPVEIDSTKHYIDADTRPDGKKKPPLGD